MTDSSVESSAQPPAAATPEKPPARAGWHWTDWGAFLVKSGGAIALIFPIIWAVVTYSNQQREQRLQDFLQAYNLMHGDLGTSIADSIDKATAPIYLNEDDRFAKARLRADNASSPADEASAVSDMQAWILQQVLVKGKDPTHDAYIQNYQQALRNLIFLYQYAKADPCTGLVVLFRFRETAYVFWYYYPGSFNFARSTVKATVAPLPQEQEAQLIVNPNWAEAQRQGCRL